MNYLDIIRKKAKRDQEAAAIPQRKAKARQVLESCRQTWEARVFVLEAQGVAHEEAVRQASLEILESPEWQQGMKI